MGILDNIKGRLGATAQNGVESVNIQDYELICRGSNGMIAAGTILMKDGNYYHHYESIVAGRTAGVTPIEIVDVAEITKNAKLVALEVRYRINGTISSMQVGALGNSLLTIKDKLLKGGYTKTPQVEETESASEDSPKFCGQCGARSKSGTKFCSECGAPLQ